MKLILCILFFILLTTSVSFAFASAPDTTETGDQSTGSGNFGLGASLSWGFGRPLHIDGDFQQINKAGSFVHIGIHAAWRSLMFGVRFARGEPLGSDRPGFRHPSRQAWASYALYRVGGFGGLTVVPAVGVGRGEMNIIIENDGNYTDVAKLDTQELLFSVSVGLGAPRGRNTSSVGRVEPLLAITYTYATTTLDNTRVIASHRIPLAATLSDPSTDVSIGRHSIELTMAFSLLFI